MSRIHDVLAAMELPPGDLRAAPDSALRFPDGAHYRIEIPSTEGPDCLRAVLAAGARLGVPVHRVSQGSGVYMLTDAELDDMAATARAAKIEVSLFARPNAGWDASATSRAPAGQMLAAASWGQDQIVRGLEDIARAADHGIRSVLIADVGLLSAFDAMRSAGGLPPDMQAKLSASFPVTNPATARVLAGLGANTLNVSSDLTIPQIAAIRAAVTIPIDFYVEAPDGLGGFVRHHDVPEIVRVAAPVHLKFGIRGAPDIYPWGGHIAAMTVAMSEERVRRAALSLELLERSGSTATTSEIGAAGVAVPVARAAVAG
jgi:hypothetical protein